jgi:hypothetical protein
LLRRGKSLVARISASQPGYTAWLGVYPLDPSQPEKFSALRQLKIPAPPGAMIYRVRAFEVLEALVEANACIWDGDLSNKRDAFAVGEDQLIEKLLEFGVKLEELEQPYKTDYPI